VKESLTLRLSEIASIEMRPEAFVPGQQGNVFARLSSMTREQKEALLLHLQEQQRRKTIRRQVIPVARQAAEPPDVEKMQEVGIRRYLGQILQNASGKLSEVAARLPELSTEQCRALLAQLLQRSWQGATKARLSFAQQRCWFFDVLNPGSSTQNIAAAVRAHGPLDLWLLEKCLNAIVARHETLRTNFVAASEGPMQVIFPTRQLMIHHSELSEAVKEHGDVALYEAIHAEAYRPFLLSTGPLMRVNSFHIGPLEHVLLLTMHHIVGDEWSIGVLLEELGCLYSTHCKEGALPPLEVQYADYAEWQASEVTHDAVKTELAFWRKQLSGTQFVLEVPTNRPRPAMQTNNGLMEAFVLPGTAVQGMTALARSVDCTNFMAMLAAFYSLLHVRTGQRDILVGTDFANRNRPETSNLIGFFVNELALRCVLRDDPSFTEILKRTRKTAVEAFSHPEIPFQWIVEDLKLERDPSRGPVFQVVFDLHNIPMQLEFNGITFESFRIPKRPAKFDMTLFISESPEDTYALLEYNTDLYDRETAIQFLHDYSRIVELAVACPTIRLSEFCIAMRT